MNKIAKMSSTIAWYVYIWLKNWLDGNNQSKKGSLEWQEGPYDCGDNKCTASDRDCYGSNNGYFCYQDHLLYPKSSDLDKVYKSSGLESFR